MRNLKKVLSVLLVVVMIATAMVPAFAAETYTYSTQAKALYDVGLFKGVSTTEYAPDLGSALTREQGIAIVVRLLGKADAAAALTAADADAALAAFGDAKDVESTLKNSVAYAVKNGLVIGDGKLVDPKGAMLGKDLATIILRNLGYTVDATSYDVATATLADKGGLTAAEATKFATKELIRDDLVGIAFGSLSAKYSTGKTVIEQLIADKVVDEAKAIAAGAYVKPAAPAVSTTVTGAKKFTVAFNTVIDPTKVTVTVKKGSIAYNVASVAAATDNKSVVVTMASKLTAGDYTISVAGVGDAALTSTVTAVDEKVSSITFNTDKAPISRDAKSISVGYKVFNQYNEDVTTSYSVTVTASRGSYSATDSDGVITITDTATDFVVDNKVSIQVLHVATGTFASTVVTASNKAQVSDVAIKSLVLKDSKELDTSKTASDYKLEVEFKDQYGNTVTDTTYLDSSLEDVTVTVNAPQYVTVAGGTSTAGVVAAPAFTYDSTAKKMYLPLAAAPSLTAGTTKVTIISNTTGKIATYDVVVKSSGKVDTLTLSAPELAVAGEKVNIPFSAVDVYGNAMTDATSLNSGMTSINATSGSVSFVLDPVTNTANLVLDLSLVNAAKSVVITGITSTSKLVQLTVDVKDPRKPVLVSSTSSSFTPNLAVGGASDLRNDRVTVKDQYGRDISTIYTFTKDGNGVVTGSTESSIYTQYRIVATSASPAYVKLSGTGSDLATTTSDTYYIASSAKDSVNPVTFTGVAKGSSAITLKLQKSDGATPAVYTNISGSEYVFTSNVVEKASIVSYELADVAPLFVSADSSAYKKAITVNGVLADGTKVVVPSSYYTLTAPDLNTSVAGYVYAKAVGTYTAITGSVTDTTVPVTVIVNATNGAVLLSKTVTVSTVPVAPKTLTLVTAENGIAKPEGTTAISTAVVNAANLALIAKDAIKNVDQYGVENTNDTYTALIVTNLTSGKSIYGVNGGTVTDVVAGNTFNLTAITSNGIVITFKVILK